MSSKNDDQPRARGRRSSGESTIYKGADGSWHGRVTMGVKDDGTPDRRHRRGTSRAEIVKKIRELEKLRDVGNAPRSGQRYRVRDWLTYWVENIAVMPNVSEDAHAGYEVDVRVHLNPGIGAHWLDKLTPEHLEKLYAKMVKDGSAPGTAHHVHRTVRNALNVAKRRGYLTGENPAVLAKAPRLTDDEAEPYSVAEVRRLLALVTPRRNGARWVIALALGLRQGEALGLKWEDVDLSTGLLRIRRNRLRPKYAHGCGDTCGRKAGYCPERRQIRPDTGSTKSRAGRRVVGLPDPLIVLLKVHRETQEGERVAARQLWHDEGWVFTSPEGKPLNPGTDYHDWKALIEEAGLPDRRLHDARHTAATVLAILAVPTPTAMAIMGWSSAEMAARYQHVLNSIRKGVADQVGGLLWGAADESADDTGDDSDSSEGRY